MDQADLESVYAGGRRRGRGRWSHRAIKVVAVSLLTLGLVTALSATFLYRHLNDNYKHENVDEQIGPDRPTEVEVEGPHKPLNILVMGDDTRDGAGNHLDNASGGGSDTTILFHLSADRESAYGISIPRDSVVDRPECYTEDGDTIPGEAGARWNAAYSVGGQACTIRQLEQLTQVRVNNYVVVDFAGFQEMVDAVDGVEVCVPEDIDDDVADIHFSKGTHKLDGEEALDYVRVRHGVADGSDLTRIKRQQAFIAALAARVVDGGTLAHVDRLFGFLNAATKSLTTDISSVMDMAELGKQFKDIGLSRIRFITVPVVDSTTQPGRVEWTGGAADLWDRVRHDKPLGKLREGSIGANQAADAGELAPATDDQDSSSGIDASDDQLAYAGLCS